MISNLIAGLDVGSTWTRVVIGKFLDEFNRPELRILGTGCVPTVGVRKGAITDLAEVTSCIRCAVQEAELMAGARIDRVYVGISGDHVATMHSVGVVAVRGKRIALRDVNRVHEVARAVALPQGREVLHAIPQDYVVDHQRGINDPVGMIATRLECDLCLITVSSAMVETVMRTVERGGYRVQNLILEPLASARAVLTEDEKELGVAMVDLGGATTGLSVYYEGRIRGSQVLPFGGRTITGDLIRGLSVPFADARRVQEVHGAASCRVVDFREMIELPSPTNGRTRSVARSRVAQLMGDRLESMFYRVNQELREIRPRPGLAAGLVLTGGTASIPGIVDLAQSCFSTPVRVGVPREGLSGVSKTVARPGFASASGLALYGADYFMDSGEGASTVASSVVTRMGSWLREFF